MISPVSTENLQNAFNSALLVANSEVPATAKRTRRFLSRQIHKIKKLLKLRSNSVAHQDMSIEEMQNAHNERINRDNGARMEFGADCDSAYAGSETWDSWDACYMCAGGRNGGNGTSFDLTMPVSNSPAPSSGSICYVFMPGKAEPVPVKLRTSVIPGGAMWISYRPDLYDSKDVDDGYDDVVFAKCCSLPYTCDAPHRNDTGASKTAASGAISPGA